MIEHDEHGPAEGVGERLVERGYDLEVFRVLDDPADPVSDKPFPDASDHDVLVLTGSPWSLYDTESIGSWIGREVAMVREAHDAGVRVLGLCFGAQVLSAALGGEVTRSDTPEFGWHLVRLDNDREVIEEIVRRLKLSELFRNVLGELREKLYVNVRFSKL